MSSSDTDAELLLFTREDQRGILEVVKQEVGHGCDLEAFGFSDSFVTSDGEAEVLPSQANGDGQARPAAATSDMRGSRAVVPPSVGPPPCATSAPPGSVPAVNRWPGEHAFRVTVCQRDGGPAGRQPPYVYSAATGKLYTDLLVGVPFRFAYAAVRQPAALLIRALPVYLESQHVQTPVRRCALHREAAHPSNVGTQHVRHVLRAQHPHARYDERGERYSVTVPLEPLEPATADYAVLFEFACMNTCVGGMNRRRVMIVFSLEERSSGRTLGRQAVEVKICKCPHRDLRNDNKRRSDGDTKQRKRLREVSPAPAPAPAAQTAGVGQFIITADDEAMYRMLLDMRDLLRRFRRSVATASPSQPAARDGSDVIGSDVRQ